MPKLTLSAQDKQSSLVSPAISGAARPPPQPPHLQQQRAIDPLSLQAQQAGGGGQGGTAGKVRVEAESRLEKAFQAQVRKEALRTTALVLLLFALFSTLAPVAGSWWGWRVLFLVLVAGTAYYALHLRLSALSLDYSSLSSSSSPTSSHLPRDTEGEQAEWLNSLLSPLWPIIDRQLFIGVVDMMEDAIKEEAPGVVRSVRITSLSPGSHPLHIHSIRSLPSSPSQPFSAFHRFNRRGGDEEEEEIERLRESTSALDDPTEPRPEPWSADVEEQGHAFCPRPFTSSSSSSPSAAGDGKVQVEGPPTREEAEEGGEGRARKGGQEEGAVPGPFVELEVEFGYRRAVKFSSSSSSSAGGKEKGAGEEKEKEEAGGGGGGGELEVEKATENVHFVAYMGVGASKILHLPLPVLISLSHLRGRVQLRLQLVPELPFVKTVTFALVGEPEVGVAIHPLHSPLPLDVMTLPLLRQYITSAIHRVMSSFVLPRSYGVDVRKVLRGGDVAMKTRTTALLVLVLHRASNLPASDPSLPFSLLHPHFSSSSAPQPKPQSERSKEGEETTKKKQRKRREGKSDPFVTVGWRGVGKVMYKTKIVPSSLDPVWEEVCFVRVPVEPVEDGAKIRLTVMDHDRFNPNDTLGYADLLILPFASNPGRWEREKKLRLVKPSEGGEGGDAENGKERGEVVVSAAYFPLCEKLPSASTESASASKSAQSDHPPAADADIDDAKETATADADIDDAKETATAFLSADFEDREKDGEEEHERKKRERLRRLNELLNSHHPAPPSHPSGILSFQIHQLSSLDVPSRHAGPVKRNLRAAFAPGQSSSMRKADLPSSYVEAVVCDEMVFRTRLKPFSNAPYFNTGSETFCRDWREATISFAVMDYRDRDHDVLAGYVHLNLKEVLQDRCQVTKWYPIVGGSGSGRLRASILFKPLAMHVPRGLREWSVGTLEVVAARVEGVEQQEGVTGTGGKLSFRIEDAKGSTSSSETKEDGSLSFDLSSSPLYLPVLSRLSPVQVTLDERKHAHAVKLPGREKHALHGLFLMNDVVRGKEGVEVKVELSGKRPLAVPNPHNLPTLVTDPPSSNPPPPSPSPESTQQPRHDAYPSLHPDAAATSSSSTLPPPILTHSDPPFSTFASSLSLSSDRPTPPSPSSSATLTLTLRWHPGLSSHHSSLVLSASSAARAAYQLYLHRVEHEASLRQERRAEKAVYGEEGEEWEEDKEEEEEREEEREKLDKPRNELEAVPRNEGGGRRRKGGTLRWVGHVAKVATHRLKKSRHHHIEDPKPETEVQSAL